MRAFIRVLWSLLLSLFIDFLLTLLVIGVFSGDRQWAAAFFVILSWPLIWMVIVIMQLEKNHAPANLIEMQNYWNIAAIRRDTNRIK